MAFLSLAMPSLVRRRIDDWFARRNPPSHGSIVLHNRRLFILPTRFGYLYGLLILALFLAATNYENSMTFVLAFMLAALGILSLWKTHKNLLGLEVDLLMPKPIFNGELCEFELVLQHYNSRERYAVGIGYAQQTPVYLTVEPGKKARARLEIPTTKRGQFKPKALIVFTRYPTGLFHAWSWLKFETPILVYPKPLSNVRLQETMVEQSRGKTSTSTIEGDDFAGLRAHREGESLRHISWKAYAQGKGLLTKTFQGHARPSWWIDWSRINAASLENKLSYMTTLVNFAENKNQKYGLKLPGITIDQRTGTAHKQACLAALATFRQSDRDADFEPAND